MTQKNSKKIFIVFIIIVALTYMHAARADDATSTPEVSPPLASDTDASSTPPVLPPSSDATSTPVVPPSSPAPLPDATSTPPVPPSSAPPPASQPLPEVETPRDTSPPSPITDLYAQFVSSASIDLAWSVPHDDTGVTGYDIRVAGHPISDGGDTQSLSGGGGANHEGALEVKTLSNMPPDKTLFIAVRAIDGAGNVSALSNVIEVHTKKREHGGPASVQPSSGGDANAPAAAQEPLTPKNQGTVRMVIKTPSGGVPGDLIFINFINTDSGISFGGSAIDGLIATNLPNGTYKVRMLLAPQYAEPRSLPKFEIINDASVDLGVITLDAGAGGNTFAAVVEGKGGIARALGFIIQLLFQILKQLQAIATKVGA